MSPAVGARPSLFTAFLRGVCVAGTGLVLSCAPQDGLSPAPRSGEGAGGLGASPTGLFPLDEAAVHSGWVRRIAPFDVLDEVGNPYPFPFLGGFIVPRVQFVDITGNGVLDLFVQERSGELIYFENVGSAAEPELRWRSDRFLGLDIGEWFRFVDLNGDGKPDLLAEEPYSLIRVYRNVSVVAGRPEFELVPDTLRAVDGTPIFADRQNIPSITDLDCDGRLDLFLGRVDGTLARYEELDRLGEFGLPRFELVTERFEGIEIIGQIGTLHGANAMAWADLDGDGAVDLFWGDFFEPSLLLLRNTARCPSYSFRNDPQVVPTEGPSISTSGFNAPAFGDLDGDGRPDLFVGVLGGAFNPNRTASNNLHHYEQTEDGRFRPVTERFLSGVDVGSESVPAFADLTGNGLPDLVVGNKIDPENNRTGRLYFFRNEGSAAEPRFRLADTLSLHTGFHYAPAFLSAGDGTPPWLVLGTWNDGILFHRTRIVEGRPTFVQEEERTVRLRRGSHPVPAFADLFGTGTPDLFVGTSSGALTHFRNVGTPTDPRFEWVTDAFLEIDVGRRAAPTFVDLDSNGLLDLIVGSEAGGAVLYRNVGTPAEPRFELDADWSVPLPRNSTPVFLEIGGSLGPVLVSGGLSGGLVYWERP